MAELSTLGTVIKTAYEGLVDINTFTDAEKTKLGGIEAGANNYTLPAVGAALGGVLQGATVADAAAGTEVTTINALLASLRAAGVIGS